MNNDTVTVTLDRVDAEQLFDHLGAMPLHRKAAWDDRVWALLGQALGRDEGETLRDRILQAPITIGGCKAW